MAGKKENPLIGAFRAPVPGASPPGKASEDKDKGQPQAVIDPKAASAVAPAKADEGKKPVEPPKDAADPKAAGTAAPAKADEGKKPAEPPKDAADPKAASAAAPAKADGGKKPAEPPKDAADPKAASAAAPAKADEGKKPAEPPKDAADPKATVTAAPAKTDEGKKPAEPPKDAADPKAAGTAAPAKADEGKKPAEPPKDAADPKTAGTAAPAKTDEGKKPAEPPKDTSLRFVPLSKIHDLPGTYVKDQPRADYSDMVKSIKAEGLREPIILRQREDGEYQLVDGFHRMQAVKQAGMLEIRADVYEMKRKDAMDYRKTRNTVKGLPIPGTLIPPTKAAEPSQDDRPPWEEKPAEGKTADTAEKPAAGEDEIPQDFKLPITKEGQSEIITTMKITDIHPFEGHPFYVKDDKDMDDLVDSVKKFGVLEPAVVIPRKAGGFEMISGHRRRRACERAGIATMPVIVRQLDRDEATISMVDANLKRENISPMEKARAYKMKLEAMKHKAGRRTK